MKTYRYYLLPNDAVVGVRQPEHRFVHTGDLGSTRTFVSVAGREYDHSIGDFGVAVEVLAEAVEISPAAAAVRDAGLVRYCEQSHQPGDARILEPAAGKRTDTTTGRVLV